MRLIIKLGTNAIPSELGARVLLTLPYAKEKICILKRKDRNDGVKNDQGRLTGGLNDGEKCRTLTQAVEKGLAINEFERIVRAVKKGPASTNPRGLCTGHQSG